MLNLLITMQEAIIRNESERLQWSTKTENCLGLIYNSLERHFPNFTINDISTNCVNYIKNIISENETFPAISYKLLGCSERGHTLLFFHEYFSDKDSVAFSLSEVDKLRIQNRMKSYYLPGGIDDEPGMEFDDLANVTQVVIALLYFYSYYGFKLVKCRHCGRWFATKSLKNLYCNQTSPCCSNILKGSEKNCEQAVRQITQNCTRLRNGIRTKASSTISAQLYQSTFLNEFETQNAVLEAAAKDKPTVENLTAYYNFLKDTNKRRRWLGGNINGQHNETNE